MGQDTAPVASSLVGAVTERNAERDGLHGGGSGAKVDKHHSVQKTKSDGSLKDGFLATAQAVHAVGHKAKEAIKEACVMSLRPQSISFHPSGVDAATTGSDHSSLATATNSGSLPRQTKNVAPLQISAAQVHSEASPFLDNTLHVASDPSKNTWPRSSPSESPAGSSTFPRSDRRPSATVTEPHRTAVSPARRAAGGSVSTRDIKKFIKAFPEVSAHDEEHLEAIYSCALDREGLWHGKMFLTSQHLCFSGTHFTKSAKIIISYPEITGVEKKNSGGMFPNALRMTVDPDRKVPLTNMITGLAPSLAEKSAAFADEVHDVDVPHDVSDGSTSHSPAGGSTVHSTSAPYIVYNDEDTESESEAPVNLEDSNGAVAETAPHEDKVAEMQEEVRAKLLEPVDCDKLAAPLGRLRGSNSEPDISNLMAAGQSSNSTAPLIISGSYTRPNRASTTIASGIGFIKKMLPGERVRSDSNPAAIELAIGQLLSGEKYAPASAQSPRSQQASPCMSGSRGKLLRRISQKRGAAGTEENTSSLTIARVLEDHSEDAGGTTSDSAIPTAAAVSAPARPAAPVSCECSSHLEYGAVDTVLDLDVEDLFSKLFMSGAELVSEAHKRRDTHDVVFEAWALDPQTNQPVSRDVSYTVSYKPPMLSKQTTGGYEKQIVLKCVPRSAYVVECTIKTPKAPYGEFFSPVTRYCITHAGPGKARLRVTLKVDFTKRLMWKSQIESATAEGMKSFCAELVTLLKSTTTTANNAQSDSKAEGLAGRVETASADPSPTALTTHKTGAGVTLDTRSESGLFSPIFGFFTPGPASAHSDSTATAADTAARRRREKRTAIAALSTLALLLTLGLAITALNMYWMVAVGHRLDHTISGLERVRDLVTSNRISAAKPAIAPPVAPKAAPFPDEQQRYQARARNLERAHEKLNRMHALLNAAHRRAANLAYSITDANARIQDAVRGLNGVLGETEFSHTPRDPARGQQQQQQQQQSASPREPEQQHQHRAATSSASSDMADKPGSPTSDNALASLADSSPSTDDPALPVAAADIPRAEEH
ncbi:Protein Aster-A [Geranomyces variabilis]|uniref:Protein Aster-A n=1 Tax=Geranomyces variabilis TaxID=109894 RepID=A0AAD5XL72_9FUNG|nr:Protein Aster-A [Geranomyces variabilis]